MYIIPYKYINVTTLNKQILLVQIFFSKKQVLFVKLTTNYLSEYATISSFAQAATFITIVPFVVVGTNLQQSLRGA